MMYIVTMAIQKGLKPDNIFALTDESRTEFWIHVSIPGYEDLRTHYVCKDPENLDDEISEAFSEFVTLHKAAKFDIDIDDELNDPESEISKLLAEMREPMNANNSPWERVNTSDSWGSIMDDTKTNVTQKVHDLKDTFGETADKAKDALKERLKNFRKN